MWELMLPWQRPPFWIFFNPQKLSHTTVDIPTNFHEVWWKESNLFLNPPFFVSMATAAKFVWDFTGMLSTMSRCADYFQNFQNGRRCHGNHKKHEKFKVLGIGWNFLEILSWSQYGAACLTPCKYPFPLKSFHFCIFNDFSNKKIRKIVKNAKMKRLAAILKI
jgi:hypothetical protein